MAIVILGIRCNRPLERDGVIILISLTGQHHIVEIGIQRIDAEIDRQQRLFDWTEEQFRFAYRHRIRIGRIFVALRTVVRTQRAFQVEFGHQRSGYAGIIFPLSVILEEQLFLSTQEVYYFKNYN